MSLDRESTLLCPSPEAPGGPYRLRPPAAPAAVLQIGQALSLAHRERRRAARTQRRLTWLAASGYLAAALAAGPSGEDRSGKSRTVAWTCMAAGATCALFLAGRAGSRAHELEAEIAGIERLSQTLSRGARG